MFQAKYFERWIRKYRQTLELQRINSRIERQIQKERKMKECQYKVVILGPSETGKSTLIKQMKIQYGQGFSQKEKEEATEIVMSNLTICVYIILCQMNFSHDCKELATLHQCTKCLFLTLTGAEEKEISNYTSCIVRPWCKEEEEKLLKLKNRYPENIKWRNLILLQICQQEEFTNILLSLGPSNLPDSALYFLSQFDKLVSESFLPSDTDILRMRKTTTGLFEAVIPFENRSFRLIDVGGQRSERKKWIHCFEDVAAIIFVASLAEYNMNLIEDKTQNRLKESVAFFKTIMENPVFKNISFILFLNKRDIFDEKIQYLDLNNTFEEYEGKLRDKEEAKSFILNMFLHKSR